VKTGADKVKTLAANVAVERANKKKENPYLAHRAANAAPAAAPAAVVAPGVEAAVSAAVAPPPVAVDERLHVAKRDLRGRKGLHFIEAGALVSEAERIKLKEERKIIAGYSSGRKALQQATDQLDQVRCEGISRSFWTLLTETGVILGQVNYGGWFRGGGDCAR
jgi:hypothetical protein